MEVIKNRTFDEERALYGSKGIYVKDCAFDGPADGESAFKEAQDIRVENVFFNLRYPFWHDDRVKIEGAELTEWYYVKKKYKLKVELFLQHSIFSSSQSFYFIQFLFIHILIFVW